MCYMPQATSLDGITFAFQVPPNVSPGDIIQVRLTAFTTTHAR